MLYLTPMLLLAHVALPAIQAQAPAGVWQCPYLSWEQVDQAYDSTLERTVEGRIRRIHVSRLMGKDAVLYLVLDRGNPGVTILVAPTSFLSAQRILLYRGLSVICRGSQHRIDGRDVMTAREIKVGERILALRDKGGKARWTSKEPAPLRPKPKSRK